MSGRWRTASLLLRHIAASSKSITHHVSRPPVYPARRFLGFAASSAIPYRGPLDSDDFDASVSPNLDHNYELGAQEDTEGVKIPVKAYFLSTSINLKNIQAENLGNIIPPSSRSSNSIALRFRNFNSDTNGLGTREKASSYRYMVIFQYGSAVLFNIEDHEVDNYLELVRRHASGLLLEMRKDDYAVKEKPHLVEDMRGGPDYIVLKSLDTDGIRIIGSVLGQSIALDYFVSQVDSLVEEFADINRGMEKTGTFTMDKKKLLQLVGKANSNLADVILKVGLFERSEIAWRDAKYAEIYEYLREEYEVAQRFGNLDFKLKFVEHNIHFLQEVLQNRKSDFLEWCIIFLLFIENVISIYEILQDSNTIS
ncbi:uncharacterized protein LOC114758715 [Neltuma alba]|uniref:uncharacterized protein LOC114758715 n=1 Tax=Neltuma alba TaxID=207710 RepID=UPI0010A3A0D2|nr:uncharacterized protein LOC114758715 [Prosopis alba]